MLDSYSGATRVIFIAGDPIAQVKSPAGVTRLLRERGADKLVVPAQVRPGDLGAFFEVVERLPNVDGVIATVPHKFDLLRACGSLTPRARSIGAANVARRDGHGGWHGDMCDGEAYVAGLLQHGLDPRGRRALLVGAGGAGSAIAHALVDASVKTLAVHDLDRERAGALLARLRAYGAPEAREGSPDPRGFDLVINATPAGMHGQAVSSIELDLLEPGSFVGDVVTIPEYTPLLQAARGRGLRTMTGLDMFRAVGERIADFYLAAP